MKYLIRELNKCRYPSFFTSIYFYQSVLRKSCDDANWIIRLIVNAPLPSGEVINRPIFFGGASMILVGGAKWTNRMGGEVYKGHCSLPVLNIEFTSKVAPYPPRNLPPAARFLRFFDPFVSNTSRCQLLSFLPARGPNLDRKTLLRTRIRKAFPLSGLEYEREHGRR